MKILKIMHRAFIKRKDLTPKELGILDDFFINIKVGFFTLIFAVVVIYLIQMSGCNSDSAYDLYKKEHEINP